MHPKPAVRPAEPRQTAQVRFADGRIYEAPVGITLETYIEEIDFDLPAPIVAAHINGQLRELTYHIVTDSEVTPITIADSDGMRIYRRSLAFLMVTVAEELFPDVQVVIDYALNFGGFYCEVRGRAPFTLEELARIGRRLRGDRSGRCGEIRSHDVRARITSACPSMIAEAPSAIAFRPEPQTLFIVYAGVSFGIPAPIMACRAGF